MKTSEIYKKECVAMVHVMDNVLIFHHFFFFLFAPQTESNSVFSGKAAVSLRNGLHAESWKSSKQPSLQERSEKIKVMLTTKTFSS